MTSEDLIARAMGLSSATLHEAAGRTGALPSWLRPLSRSMRVAGFVRTVACPAGDNLWLHHAIATAPAGSVLLVDAGDPEHGYWGEIMAAAAQARGIAGLVITGGVRDSLQMIAMGFPVFSRTVCIRGTVKDPAAPGAIGGRLRFGDVVVEDGDFLFGDADGVFVAPADRAEAYVDAAHRRDAGEARILDRLRAGETTLGIYSLPEVAHG